MNILIVGVGGQGTLLASRVLGEFAVLNGLDCKLSEVHGMAQRGGSVVTHVKMGDKIFSPVITEGDADVIVSFEMLEAVRWLHYLKKGGIVVVNAQEIMPMPVVTGVTSYPTDLNEKLEQAGKVVKVSALKLSQDAGSLKTLNIVMLGALTKAMGLDSALMASAVESCVPEKFKALNAKAFALGFDA